MSIPLSSDEIALIHAKTEGWVAGLQLACLSLQGKTMLRLFCANSVGHTVTLPIILWKKC
jgi:LuxR family maltose regulon positive regulatory protein